MGLSIAIAQYNFCVGDLEGNTEKIIQLARKAKSEKGADLTVFPELAITGYPPEDLILRPGFHDRVSKCLKRIISSLESETIILGYPELIGDKVFNSAGVIGKVDGLLLIKSKNYRIMLFLTKRDISQLELSQ